MMTQALLVVTAVILIHGVLAPELARTLADAITALVVLR